MISSDHATLNKTNFSFCVKIPNLHISSLTYLFSQDSKISDIVMTMLAKNKANLTYNGDKQTDDKADDENVDLDGQTGKGEKTGNDGKENSPHTDAGEHLEQTPEDKLTYINSSNGGQDAKDKDLVISESSPSANNNAQETHIEVH